MNYELTTEQVKQVASYINDQHEKGETHFHLNNLMKLLIKLGVSEDSFKTHRDVSRFINTQFWFSLENNDAWFDYKTLNEWFDKKLTK